MTMTGQFFPRRKPPEGSLYIDHFCHWDDGLKRHLVCSSFYFARLKSEIVPSRFLGTWMIPGDTPRDMSWAAKYYAGERGNYEDHSGTPTSWFDCPWCGGETEPIP